MSVEKKRLEDNRLGDQDWYRWGPYLSERLWGTVREDYSPSGTAWDYFPHEMTRSSRNERLVSQVARGIMAKMSRNATTTWMPPPRTRI